MNPTPPRLIRRNTQLPPSSNHPLPPRRPRFFLMWSQSLNHTSSLTIKSSSQVSFRRKISWTGTQRYPGGGVGQRDWTGFLYERFSVDVCQRLMDVWILLAGPEVVSGASQGFSDVEEMGSIRVREQLCLILLQRAKLLNIPDVPQTQDFSRYNKNPPIAIPALWRARAEKSWLDL